MISREHRFIYIHYPKTGGSSLQTVLLPFSDDRKVVEPHQDGIDRFEVVGALTPEKHASLQDYADRLGESLSSYRIVVSVRHPFERFVSAYYSPHKWLRQTEAGTWVPVTPFWDATRCNQLLAIRYQRPLTDYLRVNGEIRRPDHVVRYEHLADDLRRLVGDLGLPIDPETLVVPHANASAASREQRRAALEDPALRARIEAFYRADMAYFGYDSYGSSA